MPAKAPCVEVAQEVAAQVRAAQLAKLAAAQAAKQSGKLPRALKTVQTALKRVKGKAHRRTGCGEENPRPRRSSLPTGSCRTRAPSRSGSAVSQKAGKTLAGNKTSVNKTAVAKAPQKPAQKRTRVASAR